MLLPSMVILDFHVERIAVAPDETDAPLIVDPNAVPFLSSAAQPFQTIAGRSTEVDERSRMVDHAKLTACRRLDVSRQAPRHLAAPNFFGLDSSE